MILLPSLCECDMLEAVIIVLLILAAVAASAQPTGDGVPLLRQVAETARSAKGWRAEGTLGESPITVSTRSLLEMRYLVGQQPESFDLTVCDASTMWNARYHRISASGSVGAATAANCNPSALDWDALPDFLLFAVRGGKDGALGCTLVRAEYAVHAGLDTRYTPPYELWPVTRELCVNAASKAVLWERLDMGTYVATLTKIERDPVFSPDEFEIPLNAERGTDRGPQTLWLQMLGNLPVHSCSGSSPSVGCAKNPFALHDGN
jgi:hypothetical protein